MSATLRLVGALGRFDVRDRALLGRDASCDIALADKSISRRHAAIEWNGEGWTVQDLESANGVFVQGQPVRAAELRDGAELMLGSVRFRVEIEGAGAFAVQPGEPAEPESDPEELAATRMAPMPSRAALAPPSPPSPPPPPLPLAAEAPASAPPPPEPPPEPPPAAIAAPASPFDTADDADLPAAQPVLSVESLAEPVRPSPARGAAAVAPRVAAGPSLLFLAWLVPNVLIGALGLYFFLGAQKGGSDLVTIEADAQKVEAERLEHLQAGAMLAEGAPEALVLCNRSAAPVQPAWIGALYRQGDESIRNFNSDYCPDQPLPTVGPGVEVRFRSARERPAECRWDGSRPLLVAWRPPAQTVGFRVVRIADLAGKCLDVSR